MTARSRAFRSLIEGQEIFTCVAGGLAGHAKFAEAAGCKAFMMSAASSAAHLLGLPDAGLLTQTELIEQVRRVCAATTLPVLADCEAGFGNAINVRRTAALVVQAGASGMVIGDEVVPRRGDSGAGKEIVPVGEALGKYQAALDARDEVDRAFVIVAKCDARAADGGSLDEVVARLNAYRAAGADVVMADGLESLHELAAVRAAVEGPYYGTLGVTQPRPTLDELREAGVAWATIDVSLAVSAKVWDIASRLTNESYDAAVNHTTAEQDSHPLARLAHFDILGFPQVREWEEQYLSPEQLEKYEHSTGVYEPVVRPK